MNDIVMLRPALTKLSTTLKAVTNSARKMEAAIQGKGSMVEAWPDMLRGNAKEIPRLHRKMILATQRVSSTIWELGHTRIVYQRKLVYMLTLLHVLKFQIQRMAEYQPQAKAEYRAVRRKWRARQRDPRPRNTTAPQVTPLPPKKRFKRSAPGAPLKVRKTQV